MVILPDPDGPIKYTTGRSEVVGEYNLLNTSSEGAHSRSMYRYTPRGSFNPYRESGSLLPREKRKQNNEKHLESAQQNNNEKHLESA